VLRSEELAPEWHGQPVLCIAGRGTLDAAAAALLSQLLEKHGIGARTLATQAVSASNLPLLDTTGIRMICLSYLDAGSFTHARFLARRLRRRLPSVPIVVGLLTLAAQDEGGPAKALTATGADYVAASFREMVERVIGVAQEAAPGKAAAEPDTQSPADPKVIADRKSSGGAVADQSSPAAAREETALNSAVAGAEAPSPAANAGTG
jgi:hypothetical protein